MRWRRLARQLFGSSASVSESPLPPRRQPRISEFDARTADSTQLVPYNCCRSAYFGRFLDLEVVSLDLNTAYKGGDDPPREITACVSESLDKSKCTDAIDV